MASPSAKVAPFLEPGTREFVDALAAGCGPPIYTLSPAAAREVLAQAQAEPIARRPAAIEDTTFPVGPTGSVRIRIVRPERARDTLPVVMHFHGGGWILGDKDTHDRMTREIAVGADAAVVFVDYDRSPEVQYPVAIEQAYAATKYVAEHGRELGVEPTRLAVLGDSVGGNMAAAVTLLAKQRGGPKIDLQVLLYPATDADFGTGSYDTFADGPWLTRHAMTWFWDAYLPAIDARREPTATPLNATLAQLRDLPEALVIVAENDVLRDEGEAYARKLSQAGVRVTSLRYNGTIHDFLLLNAVADTPAARGAIRQTNDALRAAGTRVD
jgi:acetyl esterase/lipase